ncbi:MAG: glycosyl transferase family 1 [Gammaproteobacteria bacterium]|nr:MAG: glycosyl transferase family 1 [Gammaproteobacteria bacterium]
MHFAFAITEYFPFGGAQRDFFAVVTAIADRGHEISIITTGWQGEKDSNWKLFLLEQKTQTNHGRLQELSNYVISLKQQHHFDAVVGFTRMTGLDIYFAADNSFTATRYKGLKWLLPRYRTYANIERTLFENSDLKTFFLTEKQFNQYRTCFNLNPDQSVILPVCVDKSFQYSEQKWQQARQWRKLESTDLNRIVLLFVAADFKTKGLDRIISALQQLDSNKQAKFSLWIVGDGKDKKYKAKLERLPQIEYKFWGGQAELSQFYLAADYLIHPARKEAAGMVIAEALAARLPIYITDICGYSFLVDDDDESVILDENVVVAELADALQAIAMKSSIPSRGMGSPQISYGSRAKICADQIEVWCGQ